MIYYYTIGAGKEVPCRRHLLSKPWVPVLIPAEQDEAGIRGNPFRIAHHAIIIPENRALWDFRHDFIKIQNQVLCIFVNTKYGINGG